MAFEQWMKEQKDRNDPIGDLANDVVLDTQFPWASPTQQQVEYLETRGASLEAIESLKEAKREFEGP